MTDGLSRYIVELLPHLQMERHVGILDQYYKVNSEFERLGDHAVHIAKIAEDLKTSNTSFSKSLESELSVLKDLIDQLLDLTQKAFERRDLEAATTIEPLSKVAIQLLEHLKKNHLKRMSAGKCDMLADAYFSNLMVECHRIAGGCSNVGIATVVRIQPELADHEHRYYEGLMTSGDQTFMKIYESTYQEYIDRLNAVDNPDKQNDAAKAVSQMDQDV